MKNCHCNPSKMCIEEKHGVPLENYTCKKKSLGKVSVKFTAKEIEWLENIPDGIRLAADYHDLQESMSDAVGVNSEYHKSRRVLLNTAADELQKQFEGEDT